MTDVKSKNLYELLGNDPELDSDREPEPPVKTADKTVARSGKRDAPKAAPSADAPRTGASRAPRAPRGNEGAFRDREAGSSNNRSKPTEDGAPRDSRRGRGRGGPRRGGDRQNRSGQTEHVKQTDASWGAPTGEAELNDELAGDAIAKADEKDAEAAPAEEAEPEDNSKSYADYVAEQAEKKLAELGLREARKPNEGAKADKKWDQAKEFSREGDNAEFINLGGAKAKREKERKQKQFVDVDMSFKEQPRTGGPREGGRGGRGDGPRGGRGGPRGGAPRGDRGAPRGGAPRGDRGAPRGDRGAPRGGRGGNAAAAPALNSEEAFPSLGGK